MAQKDTSEKILESYNDVFSDIVNVLLFNGKQVLLADELEDQAPRSYYKVDGKIREIERDVAKRWKNGNIRVACIGFENQTASDPNMPLRVMGYDGAEYRAQLLGDGENLYPVVTLVLYFGHDKPWNGPLSLKERLNIPKEFEPYVNDYKINLFQIAYLTHEQVPDELDFASVDVSFISLKLILPPLNGLLKDGGHAACLVKPQFEAGREKVGKKGVVRDPAVHLEVLEHFLDHAGDAGFTVLGLTYSPIRGPEGNIEYLGYLEKGPRQERTFDLKALVDESHQTLKEHGEGGNP